MMPTDNAKISRSAAIGWSALVGQSMGCAESEFNMQEYRDKEVIDALFGKHADLEKQGKADIDSGKADRFVIGEMPKKGMTLVINDLKYIVFSVTDGGTVVLKLQGS